jgi:hypothetical protein
MAGTTKPKGVLLSEIVQGGMQWQSGEKENR